MYVKYPKVNRNDRPDSWLLDDLEFSGLSPVCMKSRRNSRSSRFGIVPRGKLVSPDELKAISNDSGIILKKEDGKREAGEVRLRREISLIWVFYQRAALT